MRKIKSEMGSITLVVLATVLFLIIILATISTTITAKRKSQQVELDDLKKAYDGNLEEIANERMNKPNTPILKQGMTKIMFKNATESQEGQVIAEESDEFKPNSWYDYTKQRWANAQTEDGSMWVWIPRYAYKITYFTDENKTTKSSNKTLYGNIEIKFLSGTTDTYYDEESGKIKTAQRCTDENDIVDTNSQTNGNNYTVHPAFTDESKLHFRNGGWDEELEGIWVAKFEAGYANASNAGTETLNGISVLSSDNKNTAPIKASSVYYTNYNNEVLAPEIEVQGENPEATGEGSISARNWQDGVYGSTQTAIKYPTFQGSTYSMNYINHNDAYLISRKLNETGNIYGLKNDSNSHLMKNSEWGAVAYLAHSSYGYIGAGKTDIATNSKNLNNGGTSATKAQGNKQSSLYAVTGYNANNKQWNNGGENASTTSNIYGVYDMSGGVWERIPAYVPNGNTNLSRYCESIGYEDGTQKTVSTKYTTVYPTTDTGTLDEIAQESWEANTKIYGDGISETSVEGTGSNSWNEDYSYFASTSAPVFFRGGFSTQGTGNGIFAFHRHNGNGYYHQGFRAVLV